MPAGSAGTGSDRQAQGREGASLNDGHTERETGGSWEAWRRAETRHRVAAQKHPPGTGMDAACRAAEMPADHGGTEICAPFPIGIYASDQNESHINLICPPLNPKTDMI